jgi:hypothetical protein
MHEQKPTTPKPMTHTVFALHRSGSRRTPGRWVEVGVARIESGANDHHVYLDRLPVGGFSGRLYLAPVGIKPPDPTPAPVRPTTAPPPADDEDEF